MPIWFQIRNERLAPAAKEEPQVQSTIWRMVRVETGEQFLVIVLPSGSVRTTSALKSLHTQRLKMAAALVHAPQVVIHAKQDE